MKNIFLFTYLLFYCLLLESHGLVTKHKFDKKVNKNYLSEFLQPLDFLKYRKSYESVFDGLIKLVFNTHFNGSDESNPINLSDDLSNDNFYLKSENGDKNIPDNTIAECIIFEDGESSGLTQKFYMPLRDAQTFAKNFESNMGKLKVGDRPFKVLNLSSSSGPEDSSGLQNLRIKCTPVSGNEVKDPCKACLYFEEMVSRRHFRFGHILDCTVLECMSGYDKMLVNSSNGYYFNDYGKFHPICMT